MATGADNTKRRSNRDNAPRLVHTRGTLHKFRPDIEELSTYLEKVDIFFATNDVPNDKKVPVLLGGYIWSTA